VGELCVHNQKCDQDLRESGEWGHTAGADALVGLAVLAETVVLYGRKNVSLDDVM
jgi:hypothetical protein